MKPIGEGAEAAARAIRHRKFHWCRRPNGFSDMPIWRLVAGNLGLPVYQVLAFVNRLEELGNAAANYGEVRGAVARFSAQEFAEALGMPAPDCARIFAELERPEIGWLAYDHIADFYDRNPDREDETAAERKRRQRLRDAIRRQLAGLARAGTIGERERLAIEEVLGGTEVELRNLQARLARAALSKNAAELSTVTRDGRMSQRDIVTVTPEQSKVSDRGELSTGAVDNSGGGASGQSGGPAKGESGAAANDGGEASRWIAAEGTQLVIDRLQIGRPLADLYVERWRRDLQDDTALRDVMLGADGAGYIGAQFHTLVTNGVKREVAARQRGRPLPLMPPRPGQRRDSA